MVWNPLPRSIARSCALLLLATSTIAAAPQQDPPRPASPKVPVQKISANLYRLGSIQVDTQKREATVAGKVNEATVLEFVANTVNGMKAYESALTLETDAVTFNAALLLIGLDPARARVPTQHFDPIPPSGDPVEIFVEWNRGKGPERVPIETLLFDKRTNKPLPEGPWVYTGSSFVEGKYRADLDGVLIGFVHSPSPIIENPRDGAVGAFGAVVLNPNLGLPAGTPVTVTVKALGPARERTK